MNEELAKRAHLSPASYVLDTGCGWGDSCIWLAKNCGVRTLGINIEPEQIEKAREKAGLHGVEDKASFVVGDYHQIQVSDCSFDVVWAIESICHSPDKAAFAREAYRVLKPGGRLVMSDYFRLSRSLDPRDEALLRKWLRQWVVPDLATVGEFTRDLAGAGFADVAAEDVTTNIRRSARRMFITGLITSPLALAFRVVGLHSKMAHGNWKSSLLQYRALTRGSWRYVIFLARKQ
jgi:ubiquinone/menaquinone biosynthesis C-methylase UbiE